MNRFRPAPALRVFRGHARVIKPTLIEEVAVTVRPTGPGRCWDRIDDRSKVTLACSPRLLRLFSVLDIGAGAVPPHDLARLVAKRLGTNQEPTISAIMAAKTRLNLIGFSGSQ